MFLLSTMSLINLIDRKKLRGTWKSMEAQLFRAAPSELSLSKPLQLPPGCRRNEAVVRR
jgi:hypothetical protein